MVTDLVIERAGAVSGMNGLLSVRSWGRYCDNRIAVTGSIEVGVDFDQSRELKPFAQIADREGTERDLVFVWLELAVIIEDEYQMGHGLSWRRAGISQA